MLSVIDRRRTESPGSPFSPLAPSVPSVPYNENILFLKFYVHSKKGIDLLLY